MSTYINASSCVDHIHLTSKLLRLKLKLKNPLAFLLSFLNNDRRKCHEVKSNVNFKSLYKSTSLSMSLSVCLFVP